MVAQQDEALRVGGSEDAKLRALEHIEGSNF